MKDDHASQSVDFLDFELEIGPGQGRDYPVTVLSSPAGETRDTMRFPFDELQLESHLKDVQIALLLPAEMRRRAPTAEEQGVQRFGRELFNALMAGEIRSAYDISWRQAEAQGKGLRVKLRVQSPALASLPWEFLYDPREGEYLSLMTDRPVVRYIETSQPVQPLTVTLPLRILGMVASPAGMPELNVEQEKLRLSKATEALQASGLVELVWLEGQTWRDLQRAMRGGPWHVFHFVGHGGFDSVRDEGVIVMTDEAGQPHYLTATDVSRLLADHKPLRLVLLNACEGARGGSQDIFSSTASILVRRGIPAVVAMQYPVTDRAAVEFARSFYESLADGLPVDASVAEARKAVSFAIADTAEWGTPVLFMRTSDGRVFDVGRAAQVPWPAPALVSTSAESPVSPVPREVALGVSEVVLPTPREPAQQVTAQPSPITVVQPTPATARQPRSQPAARPAWLWPAVGGLVGLVAIVVAVFVTTRGGGGKLTPTPGGPATALALATVTSGLPAALPTVAASIPPAPTMGIGSTMVSERDSMTLVYVPAGEFLMGSADSDSEASPDEKPQHKVTLDAYWIDRTEVTNAMFAKFVAATSYKADAEKAGKGWVLNLASKQWEEMTGADWQHSRGPGSDLAGLDQHPAVQVSWNDAMAYCGWAGRRLPTEAEWEAAARGTDERKFPWGNQNVAGDLLNFADRNLEADWADKNVDDGYQFTAPVGNYPKGASPYGALDMAGNVWEWVADWYDEKYYASSPAQNPKRPDSGQYRVVRGGSWDNVQGGVRAADRHRLGPDDRYVNLGFRCARSQ